MFSRQVIVMQMTTYLHMKGFEEGLVLKQRHKVAWKLPVTWRWREARENKCEWVIIGLVLLCLIQSCSMVDAKPIPHFENSIENSSIIITLVFFWIFVCENSSLLSKPELWDIQNGKGDPKLITEQKISLWSSRWRETNRFVDQFSQSRNQRSFNV